MKRLSVLFAIALFGFIIGCGGATADIESAAAAAEGAADEAAAEAEETVDEAVE